MYRKVGAIVLGLALLAALTGKNTTSASAESAANESAASQSSPSADWQESPSGLADRDDSAARDPDAEIAALLIGLPSEADAGPEAETAADTPPATGYANPDAGKGPSQEQIRTIIEQSYRRSGNDGGGD